MILTKGKENQHGFVTFSVDKKNYVFSESLVLVTIQGQNLDDLVRGRGRRTTCIDWVMGRYHELLIQNKLYISMVSIMKRRVDPGLN